MNIINNLMSGDLGVTGIYRAKLLTTEDETDIRVYVPGVNNICPFDANGNIDLEIYNLHKKSFPKVQWCCYNLESKELVNQDPLCWVMFENGDFRRPVVISYAIIGGLINPDEMIGNDSNTSGNNNDSNNSNNTSSSKVNGDTVVVNWWHDKVVTYYVAGGGTGTVKIKSETTTGGLMYMYRRDWNKNCRQYKLQQKYISEYSSAKGLITINGMPVVATIDFWKMGNAYVGRVICVEFENGVKCNMVIGDVKGNIANSSGVDYTVLDLGHLMGNSRNIINIIEYGCNLRLPSASEINNVTHSDGANTKSITLLNIDLLS